MLVYAKLSIVLTALVLQINTSSTEAVLLNIKLISIAP